MHRSSMLSFMGALQALTILLLASLAGSAAPPSPSGYRFSLTQVDSKGGFSRAELMRRAAHRSRLRAATTLSGFATNSSISSAQPRLHYGGGVYLMELAIGTPSVPFVAIAIADTGSDLIWTQCQPCTLCFLQDTPIYNSYASSTFSTVPRLDEGLPDSTCTPDSLCSYFYSYGDGSNSTGILGTETIMFTSTSPAASVDGVVFGCGFDNGGNWDNSTGLVGLGRGTQSLVAQLWFGKFSYCLTDFFNPSLGSPALFGTIAELSSPLVQTTPLVPKPANPSWYYVSLEGISLGDTLIPIPEHAFDLRGDGSGGMFVDSGTTFTALVESAFTVVSDHVAEALGQPAANSSRLDMPCFPAPSGAQQLPTLPDLVLHFAGGADMRLPRDNYMFFDKEDSSFCLMIDGVSGPTFRWVLGNFQQQNIQVLFDTTLE